MELTIGDHNGDAEIEDANLYIPITGSTIIRNGCEAATGDQTCGTIDNGDGGTQL